MKQRTGKTKKRIRKSAALLKHRGLFLYLVLFAASLTWISLQGGTLPYLVFYTVLLIPAASALYLFCVCKTLRFYQGPSSHLATRSEGFAFPIILENTGPLPIVSLRMILEKERCSFMDFDDTRTWTLNPGERLEFSSEIICLYAGAYLIGVKYFVIRDCFGLFTFKSRVHTPWRAIVRPQITDRADALMDMEHLRSAMEIMNPWLSEPTLGTEQREYRRGDSIRHIHWKNSARTGKLLIRKPEPRQMEQVRVLLLPEPMTDSLNAAQMRDHFLELAVSIADYFCRQNQSVVFYYPRHEMKELIVDSYENFEDFYEQLPDVLADADKNSLDWKTWLTASGGNRDDLLLLLREEHVDDEPLILY